MRERGLTEGIPDTVKTLRFLRQLGHTDYLISAIYAVVYEETVLQSVRHALIADSAEEESYRILIREPREPNDVGKLRLRSQ